MLLYPSGDFGLSTALASLGIVVIVPACRALGSFNFSGGLRSGLAGLMMFVSCRTSGSSDILSHDSV